MASISYEKKLYQRLKTLSDAFLLSSWDLDYKAMLRAVTKHFKVFTEADASVLMLHDTKKNLTPVCSLGIPLSKVKDTKLPSSTRLKDILSHPILDARYASFMNIPLIQNRKLIGLCAVFSTVPEKFDIFEHDKYENLFLTMLASYISVNVENVIQANSLQLMERSKSEWENSLDTIDTLVSIHDADFTIIRANTAVAKKFNTDIKEIIGKKCYKVFHGTEEPWKTCPHRKSLETKTQCSEEIEDPYMCGIFNITASPFFNDAGKYLGTLHVTRDITKHKKL